MERPPLVPNPAQTDSRMELLPVVEEPVSPSTPARPQTPPRPSSIDEVTAPPSPSSPKKSEVVTTFRRLSSKSDSWTSWGSSSRTNTDLKQPTVPQRLGRRGATHVVMLIGDILLCLFPLSFLILAGMTGTLSGKPISDFGQRIAEWSLLGPTIFPIFFAGIVGRTMKFAAGYRLERGAPIESLEQLIGSQSVFGAIFTQVVLQKFSILSFCIMIIWAFSPLGGQASLRILYTQYNNITSTADVAYLNMSRQISGFEAGYSESDSRYVIDALYAACLLSPESVKTGSQDNWGNVKIPQMQALNTTPDANGWMSVDPTNVTYSSLLGIPVSGIPKQQNATFNLHTSYYDIQCSSIDVIDAVGNWLPQLNLTYASSYNTSTIWGTQAGTASFFLGSRTNATNARLYGNDTSPVELVFVSRSGLNGSGALMNVTAVTCALDITFVESQVSCSGSSSSSSTTFSPSSSMPNCAVTAMRNDTTIYEIPKGFWWSSVAPLLAVSNAFGYFTGNFELATTAVSIYQSTPTEHYLSGEEFYPFAYGSEVVALYNVSLADFSRRFGQVLNTYWLAGLGPEASTGNLPNNVTALLQGDVAVQGNFFEFAANATTATLSHLEEVYACSAPWLAVLVIASILLFLLGVAGTVARYATLGPDVLGYVSSQVADSRFIVESGLDEGGNSSLDGLHRTRALKGLRLRLEDVRPTSEVGYVAVAAIPPVVGSSREEEEKSKKLKAGRLYA